MGQLFVLYCEIGIVVATLIYLVNRQIRRIKGPSINDRLVEVSLATCPLQGYWAMPLVTGLAYSLVAVLVVVAWPYALFVNIQRWRRYKPPMSDDELKSAMRELRHRVETTVSLTTEEIEAERAELRKLVSTGHMGK